MSLHIMGGKGSNELGMIILILPSFFKGLPLAIIWESVDILEGQKKRRYSQKQNSQAGRMAIAKSAT